MRMTASWFRSKTGSTEYKFVTREVSRGIGSPDLQENEEHKMD